MSLVRSLLNISKSSKLVSLQRLFVVPFVRIMPSRRYERVNRKWNPFFKLFAIFSRTLMERLFEEGELEDAVRIASEIVFSRGILFNSPNYQSYMLFVGLIRAHEGKYEQAASWLGQGFSAQNRALFNRSLTHSYSSDYKEWLIENRDKITNTEGWGTVFEQAGSENEGMDLLLIYIAILLNSTGLNKLVAVYLTQYDKSEMSDWKKIIISRRLNNLPVDERKFTDHEIWNGSFSDIEQKIITNAFHGTFMANFHEQPFSDQEEAFLANRPGGAHVFNEKCLLLRTAFYYLYNGGYALAKDILAPTVEENKKYLDGLVSRTGPKKLFFAGFGWSGSGAVHDALKAYPGIVEMPGAGDEPYLNDGAESEPMLHHGPGSVYELVEALTATGKINATVLKRFFKNYVLLVPSYTYFEYKTIHANRNIIRQIGMDCYYLILCEFAYNYAGAMCSESKDNSVEAIEIFQEKIINAMFRDDQIAVFNNSLYPQYSKILKNIRGSSYYVAVNRNMSDQFCDQFRSNKFFSYSFPHFYVSKFSRLKKYEQCKEQSRIRKGVKFIDIMFEDWVQDPALRKTITREILNQYDTVIESKYFNPEMSKKNTGIARTNIPRFDRLCIYLVEKCGLMI